MTDKVDKLVKEQQSNIKKRAGLAATSSARPKVDQKIATTQDSLNDLLGSLGVADFLEFMSKYAVDPTGAGHMKDVDIGAPKTVVDSQTGETRTVQQRGKALDLDWSAKSTAKTAITFGEFSTAAKKIAHAHFEKSHDGGGKFRLAVETIKKAHSFPIYYLPWESNKVLRLTIPKKGTAPATLDDPDIFF